MPKEHITENSVSLSIAADKLVFASNEIMRSAKSEEDLRMGFEKALEPLLLGIGVKSNPKYEKSIYSGGRSDALHGQVVIEYEAPNAFQSQKWVDHAFGQLVGYIEGEAKAANDKLFLFDPKLVGIGFDGVKIFFVRYSGNKSVAKDRLEKQDFELLGPYPFDQQSARTFLTYLRALNRRLLTAENLAEVFGEKSALAPLAVSGFANALEYWDSVPRIRTFYNEWKRLFGIVYGESFTNSQAEEVKKLSEMYKVGKDTDFQELLFSIHTYFVFLMKLIAVELVNYNESSIFSSFSNDLAHADKEDLRRKLEDIEEGGIFARRGIHNFLEGDFFKWYVDALACPQLEEAIREIARAFSEFEPATTVISPASTRDLLKKLYQYLVPREVRHKLGEYYTPDWLAELVINEVGYDGNTLKRALDPACGSGTFLVLAIQRAREYARKNNEPDTETAKRILANIWGFDLNPLAVIAARTNYLFALGDLVHKLDSIEIPIYLCDSVLTPARTGGGLFDELYIEIPTSVQIFRVPRVWVENNFLLKKAAPLVERMVKDRYSAEDALARLKTEGLVFPPHEETISAFYREILILEEQGKNGIWARFLKNSFAPMSGGQFDYVIGNPPWIRWGYLSEDYRHATLPLWQNYGLFSLKGHAARLGGGEKDFSMLFTYAASDYYLGKNGKLGFLITQEVFKSKGAGEGFRRFRLGNGEYLNVIKAHDFVSVQPFEGAANKTAVIILKKGSQTEYPLPYILWGKKKGGKIATDMALDKVLPLLQRKKLAAKPISGVAGSWQTMQESQSELEKIGGENAYQARRGAETDPYGVFLLDVIEVLSNGDLIVRNLHDIGKKEIQKVEERVEQELIYPAIRGSDVERWGIINHIYSLMVQDAEKRVPYSEDMMKKIWPRIYSYLIKFKPEFLARGSKSARQLADKTAFYAMFGIGPYTISSYKVAWKGLADDIIATVISQIKTPFGYKMIFPLKTISFFDTNIEDEAHYLCAIVNSIPVRDFIKSYSSAGRGFGAPSVMKHIGIPKFDSKNLLHLELSKMSQTLHQLKAKGEEKTIPQLEKENDELVKKLFGIL